MAMLWVQAGKGLTPDDQALIKYLQTGGGGANHRFTPQAMAWLIENLDCLPPQIGGNIKRNARMMSAHFGALAEGLACDSREYFAYIDKHLR